MNPIIENNKASIFDLCEQNHVKSLYLFGSVLDHNKFKETSDIDMLVSFYLKNIRIPTSI